MRRKGTLPTHIINLKSRNDRNAHIIKEFKNRNEFEIKIVEAYENPIGAIGLWNSFVNIIKTVADNQNELVVICEDDHQFTTAYFKRSVI